MAALIACFYGFAQRIVEVGNHYFADGLAPCELDRILALEKQQLQFDLYLSDSSNFREASVSDSEVSLCCLVLNGDEIYSHTTADVYCGGGFGKVIVVSPPVKVGDRNNYNSQ